MVNEQVTTIELTAGTPSTVEFSGAYPYYWVDNRSAGDVYAWAKASSKPSYTYIEVGAAAANHSHSGYATTTTTDSLQTQINTINSNLFKDVGLISFDDVNTYSVSKNLKGVVSESNGNQYIFLQVSTTIYSIQIIIMNSSNVIDKVAFRIATTSTTFGGLSWTWLKTSS